MSSEVENIPKGHPRVILISGTSSSGKSSLARILQAETSVPFLHVQLDSFIEMLPPAYSIDMFMQMVTGFHRAVIGLLETGHNVIVDHVLIEDDWLRECREMFSPYGLLFVGLDCPLEELERRESSRDARRQGFARQQLPLIHQGKQYDLLLDSGSLSPTECARKVFAVIPAARASLQGDPALDRS